MVAAQRQTTAMRARYFEALMRQEMGWYDEQETGALTARIDDDVSKIQEALGDKLGSLIQFLSMFFAGMIVAFIYGWKLALVILSVTPLLVAVGFFFTKFMATAATQGQASYADAGSVAYEAIGLIRTVVSFGAQRLELERYNKLLDKAALVGIRSGRFNGVGMGLAMLIMFCTYGLAFWYGSELLRDGEIDPGDITTVFFSVIMGAMALGQAGPSMTSFANGRGAAVGVFNVLDRKSKIDSLSEEGAVPEKVAGRIEFRNVTFAYPSRPSEIVLRNFNLVINAGDTVALV